MMGEGSSAVAPIWMLTIQLSLASFAMSLLAIEISRIVARHRTPRLIENPCWTTIVAAQNRIEDLLQGYERNLALALGRLRAMDEDRRDFCDNAVSAYRAALRHEQARRLLRVLAVEEEKLAADALDDFFPNNKTKRSQQHETKTVSNNRSRRSGVRL
jgi:hypothetical protein